MTEQRKVDTSRFQVIDGGRRTGGGVTPCLQLPPPPQMAAPELAAELAELYALALIRDVPFSALRDPHCVIWVDGRTRFTLHELLCEIRSLSWFDRRCEGALAPESEARRAQRLGRDGQLTLGRLFGAGDGPGTSLSLFHWVDRSAPDLQDTSGAAPDAEAPMSAWVDWVARQSGAALALPTAEAEELSPLDTPRQLVERLQAAHPCRVFYNAALMLIARGTAFDPGLDCGAGEDPVSAQRLLALMSEAAERAFEAVMRHQSRADRPSPPAVTAARVGGLLARDDLRPGKGDPLRGAAEELRTYAPNLLHWIELANRQGQRQPRRSLAHMLPEMTAGGVPPQAADSALQVVIAGALSTLFKALFDTRPAPRLRMATDPEPGIDIGREVERLARDIARAPVIFGAQFPAETHQNLRIGEALALQVLQGWVRGLPQGVSMEMTDFDGHALRLDSHLRRSGAVGVTLRRDGRPTRFPMLAERRSAHLAVI